jgi:hypothetical protein
MLVDVPRLFGCHRVSEEQEVERAGSALADDVGERPGPARWAGILKK